MIVLDTHTWIWFISKPEVLSKQTTKAVSAAVEKKSVLISSIVSPSFKIFCDKIIIPAITQAEKLAHNKE